jgi:hypothetical protein
MIMCNLAGLLPGWWSVIGIALDLIGFVVLAVDLVPGYLRQAELGRLNRISQALEYVGVQYNPPEVDQNVTALVMREWRKLKFWIPDDMEAGTNRVLTQQEAREIDGHIAAMRTRTMLGYTHREEVRRPAPIFAGIGLVVVGALFEIVGSWPCS